MTSTTLSCHQNGCNKPVDVSNKGEIDKFISKLGSLYRASTGAGDNAAQYWADISVKSKHPLAPLANIPGVFAALWTPEVAPATALMLATAGYGFAALPKNLAHFTTVAGARGIAATGKINATNVGLFGPLSSYFALVIGGENAKKNRIDCSNLGVGLLGMGFL